MKMGKTYGQAMSYPEAFITRSKSKDQGRLKIYSDNTIYLDNNEEFQLEIFNTTKETILAKIEFNGTLISDSGLVLKQGQRVFLDRFIDENKKFIFETYNVENTKKLNKEADLAKVNSQTKKQELILRENLSKYLKGDEYTENEKLVNLLKEEYDNLILIEEDLRDRTEKINNSISDNGLVSIYFFKKKKDRRLLIKSNDLYNNYGSCRNDLNRSGNFNLDYLNCNTTADINSEYEMLNCSLDFKSEEPLMETGTIGTGSKSDQEFETVNMDFENSDFHSISYKILPLSEKSIESTDLRTYCCECGKKLGKSDKFCSQCGTKID